MSDGQTRSAPQGGGSSRREQGGRKKFVYDATDVEIITDGYMSTADAQAVLLDAMEQWGINGTTDREIDPLLGRIAHALRQGTSAERDFSKVSFAYGNKDIDMDILRLAASKKDSSENPVRVWARSYGGGEVAVRVYDMLRDPENLQLREEAALDYMCSLDVVHVAFDFADALPKFSDMKLTQNERYVIKTNTANKVRSSRSAHIGGSDGGAVQDAPAHRAAVETGAPVAGMPTQPSNGAARARAGFAAMR